MPHAAAQPYHVLDCFLDDPTLVLRGASAVRSRSTCIAIQLNGSLSSTDPRTVLGKQAMLVLLGVTLQQNLALVAIAPWHWL